MSRMSEVKMTPLQEVIHAVGGVQHPFGLSTRDYRALLIAQLAAAGWTCRTRFKVDSRGTVDGYRGILDLVAHPPFAPGQIRLDDPVLIEIDGASIRRKTIAKLRAFPYTTAGKVVILLLARAHPPVESIDAVVCLG